MDGVSQRSTRRVGLQGSSTGVAAEWTAEPPSMSGIDRLFREIATYLEFVAIARGRHAGPTPGR